jgi:positive regulator of sigma E activity
MTPNSLPNPNPDKGPIIAFIEHPVVQAVSASFTCGLIGFALAAMLTGVFGAAHTVVVSVALIALGAMGTWGFVSQYKAATKKNKPARVKRDFMSHLAPLVGAAVLFGGAARYLGVTEPWQTVVTLSGAIICCIGLWVMSRN